MVERKKVLGGVLAGALLLGSFTLAGCGSEAQKTGENSGEKAASAPAAQVYQRPEIIKNPDEALNLLKDGNARFASDKVLPDNLGDERREELKKNGQHPFAIIVSCSDSRVPPEIVFDQALGDLFVVRVAGNVVDPVATGSVEYAAEHLGTPLIVVLGHEKCGAVTAAVKGGEAPGSIGSIVEKIKPSVEKAKATGLAGDQLVEKTAELNVEASMVELEKSPIIKELVEQGKLKIVGAKYHLGSGQVEWLETK
ncbi:carbonic anhydrase [Carboxydocella sp. JDF658]|uniref:carbonic anhydrase n=1 Tax=Carboxydocella sp. JDF658 TaxID=1926600 RepID=UPI0009AC4849|nr:carbonic anhydrase [Carboxydocella sp. JDF658]GAW32237.1 hypothetical protein JDF658_20020 [Carboxydocella sp. JDF658]